MITAISLENFAAFKKLDLKFSSGINIIIGENSCGKTQLLKSIYALSHEQEVTSKLLGLFKPNNKKLTGLYHRGGEGKTEVRIEDSSGQLSKIEFGSRTETVKHEPAFSGLSNPVLVPTKEVLSLLEAIQTEAVPQETLSILFDDSIVDLCRTLLAEPSESLAETVNKDPRLGRIIPILVNAIGGKFEINGSEHVFVKGLFVEKGNSEISKSKGADMYADFTQLEFRKTAKSETSVTMIAEGYRKIGLLQRLIHVGALAKGKANVLLWDEPESNINPVLMRLVVECLLELARNGQQVIIATHDYVLLKWFDLLMDESKGDHVLYHALFRDEDGEISKETVDNYKMLSENSISRTYSSLYDAEIKRSLGVK
ncbi:AAA family ATPase [Proteus sp. ZN5]|uniref:AAA family ATPase n=1 Tax=Proteus sp. ZN5 TaxID=2697019 RepID=UPI0013E19802|nr:AAA family ATPase [Proteus sp. ZN5]QIG07333.1 AAA family ATPase [Proteus sp. ZN5]